MLSLRCSRLVVPSWPKYSASCGSTVRRRQADRRYGRQVCEQRLRLLAALPAGVNPELHAAETIGVFLGRYWRLAISLRGAVGHALDDSREHGVHAGESPELVPNDERGNHDGNGDPDHVMTLPTTPPHW